MRRGGDFLRMRKNKESLAFLTKVASDVSDEVRKVTNEFGGSDRVIVDESDVSIERRPEPRVVVVTTTGRGFMVDKVSGSDMPPDIEALFEESEPETLLVSTLIAQLSSRGFTIAGQSASGSGSDGSPELIFTLIAPPVTRETARNATRSKQKVLDVQVINEQSGGQSSPRARPTNTK